jgi:phosphoribosylformimino-5-aminoimidazole carboxamide ribotide isomerase
MLDNNEETKQEAVNSLKIFPNGLQIGGGLTAKNANEFLESGASHIIISSGIFTNNIFDIKRLRSLVDIVGKEKIVLDLSCRKKGNDEYFALINKWQVFTDLAVNVETLEMLSKYCDEFLIHSVDVEGKRQGVDEELLKILGGCNELLITYAGGIRNLEDIKLIERLGKGKINFTIGSALDIFGGDLSYREVVNYVNKK